MSSLPGDGVQAIRWSQGVLSLLDQRLLPREERYLEIPDAPAAAGAIADLVVRGAPAIGVAAAYAVALSARQHDSDGQAIRADLDTLARARPTAVNLAWALDRLRPLVDGGASADEIEAAAVAIHQEDLLANRAMGQWGAALLEPKSSVLTHCNTGALATGGFGTALGVIRTAWFQGRLDQVYAGETRPWMQGARLTAWELQREGVPVTLVLEGAVASLFRSRGVSWLVVGADRIAANGDVANKIGTYSAALHARHHGARVMVVAPRSTIDPGMATGDQVPIEERDAQEITHAAGQAVAAAGARAWNPVFDVTPNELVDAIVTEVGVARAPYTSALARMMRG